MIYVAYKYETIDQVDCLRIGCISTTELVVDVFIEKQNEDWYVKDVEDGEEWPF